MSEERIAALEQRLQRAEDELAIHNLVVRYGLAVDSGDDQAAMALFTEDAVYEVRAVGTGRDDRTGALVMKGREAVGEMVRGANHQSLLPNSAHTNGPLAIDVIDDRRATATGYSRVYHREGDVFRLFRAGANHWQFAKGDDGRWRIAHRVSQAIGSTDAQDLMRLGLES